MQIGGARELNEFGAIISLFSADFDVFLSYLTHEMYFYLP